MRFIKYNFNVEPSDSFAFCLDDLVTFETVNSSTMIILRNGNERTLDIDIEHFVSCVFSDVPMTDEYQLVEIDSKRENLESGMFGAA